MEAIERSDDNGGRVTLSEPTIVVYGKDYKGEAIMSDEVLPLASGMHAAVIVRDRLSAAARAGATATATGRGWRRRHALVLPQSAPGR